MPQMKFSELQSPYLAAIIPSSTPEEAIALIQKTESDGAEGFMVDLTGWTREQRTDDALAKVAACSNRPMMPLVYRNREMAPDKFSDDERAEVLVRCVKAGFSAVDIMGDFYDPSPRELTRNPEAIEKQKALIRRFHEMGAEVLMSSHMPEHLTPVEGVAHLLSQQERGVDIAKLVTVCNSPEELMDENQLCILAGQILKVPFVHVCNGSFGRIQRYCAPVLGAVLTFGMDDTVRNSKTAQPSIAQGRKVLDELLWKSPAAEE